MANSFPMPLLERGKRVFLRSPRSRDSEEFLGLVRAGRRLHHPWTHPPDTAQRYEGYLRRCRREDFRGLFVCLREEGVIAGVFNLSQILRGGFQNAYLGYYVGARFANRGYMTEGLRLVLRHAFHRMKLHRLEANIQPENLDSIELVRRCGFRREGFSPRYLKVGGRWRDHERWAITAEGKRSK